MPICPLCNPFHNIHHLLLDKKNSVFKYGSSILVATMIVKKNRIYIINESNQS